MRLATAALVLLGVTPSLLAQELERPSDWQVRFDRPSMPDSTLYFVTMTPGWHITTGPAGILYDPARTAAGEYRIKSEIFLFPGERREGFGVFLGGRNLADDDQSYLYFLIRKDGQYLIKRREGAKTSTIQPWTAHSAIEQHDGGEGTAKNVLEIDVGRSEIGFVVNGVKVTAIPRTELAADGVVGLRVNHNLNLHVSELTVVAGGDS
jgi:hypothetical protein